MEDSKKNTQRKVLTDEELEQVSGGRVVFDINQPVFCGFESKHECLSRPDPCYWSEKLSRCFGDKKTAAAEEAKAGV